MIFITICERPGIKIRTWIPQNWGNRNQDKSDKYTGLSPCVGPQLVKTHSRSGRKSVLHRYTGQYVIRLQMFARLGCFDGPGLICGCPVLHDFCFPNRNQIRLYARALGLWALRFMK